VYKVRPTTTAASEDRTGIFVDQQTIGKVKALEMILLDCLPHHVNWPVFHLPYHEGMVHAE
jgi:hypothetical protein